MEVIRSPESGSVSGIRLGEVCTFRVLLYEHIAFSAQWWFVSRCSSLRCKRWRDCITRASLFRQKQAARKRTNTQNKNAARQREHNTSSNMLIHIAIDMIHTNTELYQWLRKGRKAPCSHTGEVISFGLHPYLTHPLFQNSLLTWLTCLFKRDVFLHPLPSYYNSWT